jgi:hypothetical protein
MPVHSHTGHILHKVVVGTCWADLRNGLTAIVALGRAKVKRNQCLDALRPRKWTTQTIRVDESSGLKKQPIILHQKASRTPVTHSAATSAVCKVQR